MFRLCCFYGLSLSVLLAQSPPLEVPPLPVDLDKPPTLTLPGAKTPAPPVQVPPLPTTAPAVPPPGLRSVEPVHATKDGVPTSTSADGAFVVHGGDLALRTNFCHDCETIADELKRLLRDAPADTIPIILVLKAPTQLDYSRPPVVADLRQIPGGFHLQLTIQARQGLTSQSFRTELLKLLLAERILRGHAEIPETNKRIMPDWLIAGVLEALDYKLRIRPSALFAAIFKSGKIYGIEDVLDSAADQMDSFTASIYRTSAAALVLMLLDQPDGSLRFAKFLNDLPRDNRSDRELLNANFPSLAANKANLDKWWALQLANLSRPGVFENLSPAETAQELKQALTFQFETNNTAATSSSTASGSRKRGSSITKTTKPSSKPKTVKKTPADKSEVEEEEEKSGGLFSRIFGGNKEEPAEADAKPEPAKETATARAPQAKPSKEPSKPKPQEPSQPESEEIKPKKGIIRNWFKSSEPKPEEAAPQPEAKKTAALAIKDAGLLLASMAQQKPYVLAQFGLFNRKKERGDDAVASSEAAVKEAKKAAAARDAEAKAAAKELAKREAEAGEAKEKALKEAARQERDTAKKKAAEEKAAAEQKAKEDKAREKEAKGNPPPPTSTKATEKPSKPSSKKTTAAASSKSKGRKVTAPPTAPSKPVVRTSTSLSLVDYAKVLQRSDAKELLGRMLASLTSLAQRAHPSYRVVIAEYMVLVSQLATGKTEGMDARLTTLRQHMDEATKTSTSAQSYLDWYQANHPSAKGSEFEEYLSIKEVVKRELAPRVDEISLYLDEWERKQKR